MYRQYFSIIYVILLLVFSHQALGQMRDFEWGEHISLHGRIERIRLPGPPEYDDSTAHGTERVVFLHLNTAINISGESYAGHTRIKGQKIIQLVLREDIHTACIQAHGVLFEAVSGPHHERVLMDVDDVEALPC